MTGEFGAEPVANDESKTKRILLKDRVYVMSILYVLVVGGILLEVSLKSVETESPILEILSLLLWRYFQLMWGYYLVLERYYCLLFGRYCLSYCENTFS